MERGREAHVIVCDDIRVEANGKRIFIGVYMSDIGIGAAEQKTPMINFSFMAECEVSDPFTFIRFEITLPGEKTVFSESNLSAPPTFTEGRTRAQIHGVVSIPNATLRPGRIVGRVVHEKGEIPVSVGWIKVLAPPPAPPTRTMTLP